MSPRTVHHGAYRTVDTAPPSDGDELDPDADDRMRLRLAGLARLLACLLAAAWHAMRRGCVSLR